MLGVGSPPSSGGRARRAIRAVIGRCHSLRTDASSNGNDVPQSARHSSTVYAIWSSRAPRAAIAIRSSMSPISICGPSSPEWRRTGPSPRRAIEPGAEVVAPPNDRSETHRRPHDVHVTIADRIGDPKDVVCHVEDEYGTGAGSPANSALNSTSKIRQPLIIEGTKRPPIPLVPERNKEIGNHERFTSSSHSSTSPIC